MRSDSIRIHLIQFDSIEGDIDISHIDAVLKGDEPFTGPPSSGFHLIDSLRTSKLLDTDKYNVELLACDGETIFRDAHLCVQGAKEGSHISLHVKAKK